MNAVQEQVTLWAADVNLSLTSAQVKSLADLITGIFNKSLVLGAKLGPELAKALAEAENAAMS